LACYGTDVKPTKDRQRRQVYEAREVIAIFTALDRQLASS
jgi:hypothetical protein